MLINICLFRDLYIYYFVCKQYYKEGRSIFCHVNMSFCFAVCNAKLYFPYVCVHVQTGSIKDIELN